jgi:hypothetical protein
MNAISPSLAHSLARLSGPEVSVETRGAQGEVTPSNGRPDYIAAIEAAMNRKVSPPQVGLAKPVGSGSSSALVARLQARRAPPPAVPAKPVAPLLLVEPVLPPAPPPKVIPPAPTGLALGPITVSLPSQGLGYRPLPPPVPPVPPTPSQAVVTTRTPPQKAEPAPAAAPAPELSAAERILFSMTAQDTFIFKD